MIVKQENKKYNSVKKFYLICVIFLILTKLINGIDNKYVLALIILLVIIMYIYYAVIRIKHYKFLNISRINFKLFIEFLTLFVGLTYMIIMNLFILEPHVTDFRYIFSIVLFAIPTIKLNTKYFYKQ